MNIDYSKWQFEFQQRNKQPVLMADMWLRALDKNFKNEIALPVFDSMDYIFSADSKGWVSKEHKKKIIELIHVKSSDIMYLDYIGTQLQKRLNEMKAVEKNILTSFNTSDATKLADMWIEFDNVFVDFVPWFYIPWYITEENMIVNQVRNLLVSHKEKIEEITDLNNALSILMFPIKKTAFQEEQQAFYEIVNKVKESGFEYNDFQTDITKYLQNFDFLSTFLFLDIPSKNEEGVRNSIEEALSKQTHKEYALRIQAEEANQEVKQKLLAVINNDAKLLETISFAQEFGWLLTSSVEDAFKVISHLHVFFRKICDTIGISFSDFTYFEANEIENMLRGSISLGNIDLEARKEGLFYKLEDRRIEKAFGDEALELTAEINRQINKVDAGIKEFKGQPASPGNVTGKVFLALTAQESASIGYGDILVTSMTTPDFVPAMKKAAAIVTSEGGLLCHAAIISRELKKPCIVGTKIATSLLKTGDMIEIDAEKGIVKIIK